MAAVGAVRPAPAPLALGTFWLAAFGALAPLSPAPAAPAAATPAATAAGGVLFRRDVAPLLVRLGCNAVQCHGAFAGQGGLTLDLFGGAPEEDYETLVKAERGRRINPIEPAKSLLLAKAAAAVPHGGKQLIKPGSPEYQTLLAWIQQGARYWDAAVPALAGITVAPAELTLAKDKTQKLAVTARFTDGTERPVTGEAAFRSLAAGVVTVAPGGEVKAVGCGLGAVVATYRRQTAVARVIVPRPLAKPFPACQPNSRVDELVWANLKALGLPPAEPCTDEAFLRRAFLDVIGTLPTPDEARAFLADQAPDKRRQLIDRLLARDEFTAFWALKWADILRIKAEDPVSLWPKGAEVYYQWVYQSIAENKPFDRFARELLTAAGSNFRDGPVNFFRAVQRRDPPSFGEAAALAFMGARLSCARCHGHPEESWGKEDVLGMGAFFGQLKFKFTSEWKEEILYRDPAVAMAHPRTGQPLPPTFLGGAPAKVAPGTDPRRAFADWLTAPDNPWFARAAANRVWCWLLGRGIVHEPDDLRPTNPPENPALLDFLAAELVAKKFDLKHLYRLILNSNTYQLASVPHPDSAADNTHFSHYVAKRLTAEQLIDGLAQITGLPPGEFGVFNRPTLAPVTTLPPEQRAIMVGDGSAESPVAAMLGRPARATGFEEERPTALRADYVAFLADSKEVEKAVNSSRRLQELAKSAKPDAELVAELFLAALSRPPTAAETERLGAAVKANRQTGLQDALWALLNSKEFMLNH